jgi:hypothetical protein
MAGRNIASLLDPPSGLGTGSPNDGLIGTGHSGPRGVEAIIEYNGLYMNVREWVDTYIVNAIGGIDDADVRDNREVNPGYHGETPFPGYYGGRTITLGGKIQTRTLSKLRDMQQGMRQAFAQLRDDLPLYFRGPSLDLDSMIYCRKSAPIQMAEAQTTLNHFERPFLITLRASNPRFVSSVRKWNEKQFPGATFDAIAFTLLNEGNFEAQPEVELTGPITTLTITNESNGDWINLVAAIPAGETWVMDTPYRRFYRKSDNVARFVYLNVNSDWIMLEPGLNNIRVTATGLTAASRVVFWHRNTFM